MKIKIFCHCSLFSSWSDLSAPVAHFAAYKTGFWLIQFLTICLALLLQRVSWEVSSSSASRRIPAFCGTRFICRPPPVPFLSQINSFHAYPNPN